MSEFLTKSQKPTQQPPVGGSASSAQNYVHIKGTSQVNSDTFTVAGMTTVEGCALMASDGTIAACTLSTNVITITNSGTKVWSGPVWGT